jgi:hypothetical protein
LTALPLIRNIWISPFPRVVSSDFRLIRGDRDLPIFLKGSARFKDASNPFGVKVEKEFQGEELEIRDLSGNRTLVVFGAGDEVAVTSGDEGVRFLLISGAPLREPVAWHGPIVMNTQAELQTAMRELNNGTFIKTGAAGW